METPYEKYRVTSEWELIEKSINDLIENKDIELTTHIDYVVGYISKQIVHKEKEIDLRTKVILSANRALLGAITPHLRAVTVDYNNDLLILRAYFDNGATIDDKELIDVALTEIIADLSQEIKEFKYEAIDSYYPAKMVVLTDWVYMRNEDE